MTKISDVFPLSEAASEVGLHPDTLRWQIHNGRLEATKLGNAWFVTRAALQAYLEQRGTRRKKTRDEWPIKGKPGK